MFRLRKADARVDLATLTFGVGRVDHHVRVKDLSALDNQAVGNLEVHVESAAHGRPAVLIRGSLALLHEVDHDRRTALLNGLNVLEKTIALLLEDGGSELGSRLRRDDGRVEGVEHSNAVVLVERSQREFVDEDLL